MPKLRNLIIAVAIMISIFNQSASLCTVFANPAATIKPAQASENTLADKNREKLPQTIILDPHELVRMKEAVMKKESVAKNFLKTIIAKADSVLANRSTSVTEKTEFPPNGTKHDYFALASYEWPNPKTPSGLPYVSRDGMTNPETLLIKDRKYLEDMVNRVMILAIASYFTDNPKYSLKAQEQLRVWFLDKNTYMEPSLKYGDFERGKGRLNPSGIIGAHHLANLVDAISVLKLAPKWNSTLQVGLEQWFTKYLDWLLNSDLGKLEAQRANNHGTYYTVQASAIAYFLNKTDITQKLLKSTMQDLSSAPMQDVPRLIAVKINPDGTQPFEINRADSLHYHVWNLYGLTQLARIGDNVGVDLWSYNIQGAGIKKALDFIIPYALGNQTWPYGKIKQLNKSDLPFLQGTLCQAILHYSNNQSYMRVYRSLEAKDAYLNFQDTICNQHINYIDAK